MQIESPVIFSASADVQPNSTNAPNVEALRNTLKTPIEIIEMRFRLRNTPSSSTGYIGGAGMGVNLSLGNLPLTNGFVPVLNFGKAEYLGKAEPPGAGSNANTTDFYWRLPKPLLIAPGEVVNANFQHRGIIPIAVNAMALYIGRTVNKKISGGVPLDVPWVSSWVSDTMTAYSTSVESDESTENDIVTPNDREIRLQRFTGRVNNTNRTTQLNDDLSLALNPMQLLQMRMADSAGNTLVKDWSYFYNVFSPATRTWECNGIRVPANVYHKVSLRKKAASNDGSSSSSLVFQSYVSAVGWYRAKLQEIG